MNSCNFELSTVETVSDVLFKYSIDREDMKLILNILPKYINNKRNLLEYELQIFRIVVVSWAISFFMYDKSEKKILLEIFWDKIRKFSEELSSALLLTCNKDVNYFDMLKMRTDIYVNSMRANTNNTTLDPLIILSPKFAEICNLKDNAHVILAASKLFKITIDGVKQYLDSI